jgi:hypothetical protein
MPIPGGRFRRTLSADSRGQSADTQGTSDPDAGGRAADNGLGHRRILGAETGGPSADTPRTGRGHFADSRGQFTDRCRIFNNLRRGQWRGHLYADTFADTRGHFLRNEVNRLRFNNLQRGHFRGHLRTPTADTQGGPL